VFYVFLTEFVPKCYALLLMAFDRHTIKVYLLTYCGWQVRSGCEPILQRYNLQWPTSLECNRLPSRSTGTDMCIEATGEHDDFPVGESEFNASPDLLHHAAGAGACLQLTLAVVVTFKQQHYSVFSFLLSFYEE